MTDKQIMLKLDIPQSTYYWYLKQIREQDRTIIEQKLTNELHTEMRQLYDRLIGLEQEALQLLDPKNDVTPKDKLEAINTIRGLAADRATLLKEGPEYLGYDVREKCNITENQEIRAPG